MLCAVHFFRVFNLYVIIGYSGQISAAIYL